MGFCAEGVQTPNGQINVCNSAAAAHLAIAVDAPTSVVVAPAFTADVLTAAALSVVAVVLTSAAVVSSHLCRLQSSRPVPSSSVHAAAASSLAWVFGACLVFGAFLRNTDSSPTDKPIMRSTADGMKTPASSSGPIVEDAATRLGHADFGRASLKSWLSWFSANLLATSGLRRSWYSRLTA
eukprot:scaffold39105_cov76-Phaeocystis_antarctica.AAC.5